MLINLTPGTILDDRYVIIQQIGEGGMGTVYQARELGLQRIVAVKILHQTGPVDAESQERFRREGKILSALSHPNILLFYRFGNWKNLFSYISMEYLQGTSLSQILQQHGGGIGAPRCIDIAIQICGAMDYAHRHQVIHRDLKPGNIVLLDEAGADVVKIVDFGLARLLEPAGGISQHLTQTGALVGSIYYMSPEQCLGKKADARSDIYSLGCLLYEAMTGQPPLIADNPVGLMHLHVNVIPKPLPAGLGADLLTGLNSVLMKAMAKDPDRRYQTMGELKVDFEHLLAGRQTEISNTESVTGTSNFRKNRIMLATTFIAVCGCVMFLLIRSPWYQERPEAFHKSGSQSNLVVKNLPFDYKPARSSAERATNVILLQRWLDKYGRINDMLGNALAHFWLYIELRDTGQDDVFVNDPLLLRYQLTTNCFVPPVSAVAAEHRQKAKELVDQLRLKLDQFDKTQASNIIHAHLVLAMEDSPRLERVKLFYVELKDNGKHMVFSLRRQVSVAGSSLFDRCGNYLAEQIVLNRLISESQSRDKIKCLMWLSSCKYRQNEIAEAERRLNEAAAMVVRERPDFESKPFAHVVSRRLLDQNMDAEALELLKWCKGGNDDDDVHAKITGAALSKLHRYKEAHEILLNRCCKASRSQKWQILVELVHNASAGNIPAEEIVEKIGSDEGWTLPLDVALCANKCVSSNPALALKLARRAALAIKEINLDSYAKYSAAVKNAITLNRLQQYEEAADLSQYILAHNSFPNCQLSLSLPISLELALAQAHMGKFSLAKLTLQPMLTLARSQKQRRFDIEPLFNILSTQAIIARLEKKYTSSTTLFNKAAAISQDSYDVTPEERSFLLHEFAKTCAESGDKRKEKSLLELADKTLPEPSRDNTRFLEDSSNLFR